MVTADDTELLLTQSRVDRESGRGVDERTLGIIFVSGWSIEAIETCMASVCLLLGVQLVLKMSANEVLIFSTAEAEMGTDAVLSKGLDVITPVLASVFSAEAWEDGTVRLVLTTVTRSGGVDSEPDSVLDAKDEAVPTAEIAVGEPVASKREVMFVMVQGPNAGAGEAVDDHMSSGCSRADVLVSVARVPSMVLPLSFRLGVVVRTELVSMVVMVVMVLGVGAVVTSMVVTVAGDEVCDSCPRLEATSLVTTLVMATSILDPIEGNVTDGEEVVFPSEALVRLLMAWLSEVRFANMVGSMEVLGNVSVVPGDPPRVRSLPVVCSDLGLADE